MVGEGRRRGHREAPGRQTGGAGGRGDDLRDSPLMAHLLDALEARRDIGHFGRLTFAMVARHFLGEAELVRLLGQQPAHDAGEARALLRQIEARDYLPPRCERILAWQAQQDFPICPTPDDPEACDVYRDLRFPASVYARLDDPGDARSG